MCSSQVLVFILCNRLTYPVAGKPPIQRCEMSMLECGGLSDTQVGTYLWILTYWPEPWHQPECISQILLGFIAESKI